MRQQNDTAGRTRHPVLESAPHSALLEAWWNWPATLDEKGVLSSSGPPQTSLLGAVCGKSEMIQHQRLVLTPVSPIPAAARKATMQRPRGFKT